MSVRYRVGIICALPIEHAAVVTLLDETHAPVRPLDDDNVYTAGKIATHDVVITCLPAGVMGKVAASRTAANMKRSFPIEILLMVGIAGGLPPDVRLGDVVVSVPIGHGAVVQYDLGKSLTTGFQRTGTLNKPPRMLLNAVQDLRSTHLRHEPKLSQHLAWFSPRFARPAHDLLFQSDYEHTGDTCEGCDRSKLVHQIPREKPVIHYGTIASADRVVKDASERRRIAKDTGALCFEMEAAALMDDYPCLVIRGICDYADSHKSKEWQPYASAVAAAYAKELLTSMPCDVGQAVDAEDPLKNILKSLSFPSMQSRHFNIDEAYGDTCKWLLGNKSYLSWLSMKDDRFFWIKGKPGSGKSTLMKFAEANSPTGQHIRISFFFNARGGELDKTVPGMYRTLLHQLLSECSDKVPARPPGDWTLGHLKSALRLVISNSLKPIQCFVDALDECSNDEAQDMIYFLQDLTRASPLYVCFASRFYPTITIKGASELVLNSTAHDKDIEEYVRGRLDCPENGQGKELIAQLLEKANGVFFWAVLVVKMLNKELSSGNIHNIQRTLHSLPSELHNLLREIVAGGEKDPLFVSSMQWILCNQRGLSQRDYHLLVMSDLQHAEGKGSHSVPDLIKLSSNKLNKFIHSSSRGLAYGFGGYNQVQFIHESVKDFLLTAEGLKLLCPGGRIAEIHEHLKRVSMWMVGTGRYSADIDPVRLGFYHAREAASDISQEQFLRELDLPQLQEFIYRQERECHKGYDPQQYKNFISSRDSVLDLVKLDWPSPRSENLSQWNSRNEVLSSILCSPLSSLLHFLVAYNADILLSEALSSGYSLNDAGSVPPLFFGILVGANAKTLNCMIRNGIDLEERYGDWTVPIMVAALGWDDEYDEVLRLLIKCGLNPNQRGIDGRTPLHHVVSNFGTSSSSISVLLEGQADVQAVDDGGRSALHFAARHSVVHVEALLAGGADINALDNEGKTALHSAMIHLDATNEMYDIVEFLLASGADIHAVDNEGNTALHIAVAGDNLVVVSPLLAGGANINAVNHKGMTALHIAAARTGQCWGSNRGREMIEDLLAAGAHFDAVDYEGNNALHIAIRHRSHGYGLIVEDLLAAGLKTNAVNNEGSSALHIHTAVWSSEKAVFEILLAGGAHINAVDNKGLTALHLAAGERRWEEEVIQWLLTRGAAVNAVCNKGTTALHIAAKEAYLICVGVLLDAGADKSILCHEGNTALDCAEQALTSITQELTNKLEDKERRECIKRQRQAEQIIKRLRAKRSRTSKRKKMRKVLESNGVTPQGWEATLGPAAHLGCGDRACKHPDRPDPYSGIRILSWYNG